MQKKDYSEYIVGEEGPLGKPIMEIIFCQNSFIVYMDSDEIIQWATNNHSVHQEFGVIQNRISYWESITNKIFNKEEAFDIKMLLAEGYARILDANNLIVANEAIDNVVERIKRHGREVLKQQYIISSLICTLIVIAALVSIVIWKKEVLLLVSNNAYGVIATSLFGGIGAFIFAILRLRNYSPEIEISKRIHSVDGSLRILYGIIFGLFVSIGIKANIILGFISAVEDTIYVKCFMGMIAGASEVLIPNLIKQIEEKASE